MAVRQDATPTREPEPVQPGVTVQYAVYLWASHEVRIGKKKVQRRRWVRYTIRDSDAEARRLAESPLFNRAGVYVCVAREVVKRGFSTVYVGREKAKDKGDASSKARVA